MKKKLVTLIVLMLFSGTLFFIGWIQFAVPAGKYGVLLSKTNGVDQTPVIPAQFRWQWQKLIPTNTELVIFDLIPINSTTIIEGTLPSGALYSQMFEGNPDFSWKITLAVSAKLAPSVLPSLVERFSIKDQVALDNWTKATITALLDEQCRLIISEAMQQPSEYTNLASDPSKLAALIQQKIAEKKQTDIEILLVRPEIIRIPDFSLYTMASKTYSEYQMRKSTLLSQAAATEASDSVSEYLQIERFARWGEVLTKYPILIDFLAVARDDSAEAFKAVKNLR